MHAPELKKKLICIIPARLASQRFKHKVLTSLAGRPILEWIWRTAHALNLFDTILFAIDAPQTARLIESFGGRYVMTSPECPSGTHRIISALAQGAFSADVIVNWQGDSPLVTEQMIRDIVQSCDDDTADVWTLKKRCDDEHEVADPNCVKVVSDAQGRALYFSRAPIPFYRDDLPFHDRIYYKHIGLYAYTREALGKIAMLSMAPCEQAEKLEQLRFMHHGLQIRVHETQHDEIGINVPEDLVRAERYVAQQQANR